MVYYRKYRPQTISELDLASVREKLTAILSSPSIPHAFLFAGPKGLGKTSSARILAKAINCERKERVSGKKKLDSSLIEPCNKCSACISITNGSAVDVLEIDAASNRGIDEIRDLRERIKFSPSSLRKKIYIIDEVHMLTTEAFNALLKTLEEPPEHVAFILATTEIGKLPSTILSRVFLVQFEKPTKEEIARSLSRVALGENLEVDSEVMDKIGELSDGSFRDGAKLLEELSLQSKGKKITSDLLESLYRTGSIDNSVEKLIASVQQKDAATALGVISILADTNTDFKQIIEKMADGLHAQLLEQVASNNTTELSSTQKLLQLLDEAYKDIKGAVLPQLPLEIAVIEYCIEEKGYEEEKEIIEEKSVQKNETTVEIKTTQSNSPANQDLFKKLVDLVNAENKILAGLLRGCKLGDETNANLQILASSKFHYGKLTEPKNKTIIEGKLREILGRAVAIEIKT